MHISEKIGRGAVLLAKAAIAAIALYYVLSNIEIGELQSHIKTLKPQYLAYAFLLIIAAIILGGMRLRAYLKSEGLKLNKRYSKSLYWAGMFFSLLLPGGISGDGYVAVHLNKKFGFPALKAIRILLITRANGLLFLNIFLFFAVLASDFIPHLPRGEKLVYGLFLLQFPVYYYVAKRITKEKLDGFLKGGIFSFLSQAAYTGSALMIFYALGVEDNMADYLALFLAASVASILPLTPGGVGIRELIFFKGAKMVGIDAEHAIACSLVYFAVYVAASVIGLVFYLALNKIRHE
jgi:hypothetical protein